MALSLARPSPRLRKAVPAGVRARVRGRLSLRSIVITGLGVLATAVLAAAVLTFFEHRAVDDIRATAQHKLQPAQAATAQLTTAYADQQTATRGFLLTGDASFLKPWTRSTATVKRIQAQLPDLVDVDATARADLAGVVAAGERWQADATEHVIAARKHGAVQPATAVRIAKRSDRLVANLHAQLEALSGRIATVLTDQLQRVASAQSLADTATIVSVLLAVLTAVLASSLLRRMLTKPLEKLVTDVVAVADGVYDHPITNSGPREVSLAARAVAHMRDEFMRHTRRLVDAQRTFTIQDERERMSADLHDLTLQDIYALGLTLDSVRMRHPELASDLDVLVDDTRRMDRELRAIVFAVGTDADADGLSTLVTRVAIDSRRVLGFAPAVTFHGAVDAAGDSEAAHDLLAALRESLSNVARHAQASAVSVTVSLTGGPSFVLRLTVTDDGIGTSTTDVAGNGLRNLAARAERRSGNVSITSVPSGGTRVDWQVPITTWS